MNLRAFRDTSIVKDLRRKAVEVEHFEVCRQDGHLMAKHFEHARPVEKVPRHRLRKRYLISTSKAGARTVAEIEVGLPSPLGRIQA